MATAAVVVVGLAAPMGFFSGFLTVGEATGVPMGRLGTAPVADAPVVGAIFLTAAGFAETFCEYLLSIALRLGAEVSRDVATEVPVVFAMGCFLDTTAFGLALESVGTGLPLASGATAAFAACSVCNEDGTCSVTVSCEGNPGDKEGSATAAGSVGSMVSMVTPSGFIPCNV